MKSHRITQKKQAVFPFQFQYRGNLFILVLFLLIWVPLGFTLLTLNSSWAKHSSRFYLRYEGSRGWLLFWALCCFPIAIVLGLLKGVTLIEEIEESN